MEMHGEVEVAGSADCLWEVIGTRFAHVHEWVEAIERSSLDQKQPCAGATRTCEVRGFGPITAATIRERLLTFDASQRTLSYEVIAGLPWFIRRAVNRWAIVARGPERCVVQTHSSVDLRFPASIFTPLIRARFQRDSAAVLSTLRKRAEEARRSR